MYEQNYQPNPEFELKKKYNVDVSDMPDGLQYLFILPFPSKEINKNENSSISPHVFTYKQDEISLRDILKQYQRDINYKQKENMKTFFTLKAGLQLDMYLTIGDLKKILGRKDINGLFFFIDEKIDEGSDSDEYIDECCVSQYYTDNAEFGKKSDISLKFLIQVGTYKPQLLYMKVNIQQQLQYTLKKVLTQVHKQYGVLFSFEDVQSYQLKPKTKSLILSSNLIKNKVYENNTIVMKVKGKTQLKKINYKNYNSYLLIFKQGQIEPFKARYDEIADIKFIDLYKQNLQLQKSKYKKDAIYCLKIMDMIIKPHQNISKAEVYFKHNLQNKPVNIVGKVVNQKMIFYKTIPPLSAKAQFKLDDLTISKDQQKNRENCRKVIEERAMNATTSYFKNNAKNVQPITIYTSQLKYVDPLTKAQESIYISLNRYLRETKILSLEENLFQKEWRMRYASTLLKHLHNIPNYQGITWRGVTYDPQISKIGQIVTFKQFTSTSTSQAVAIAFAKKFGNKQTYHIFRFKVLTGKSIKEYSFYVQGQILLEPYSEFQVKQIKEQIKDKKKYKIYYLQQILTSKTLPDIKANFIVWIDDKLQENKQVFDKFNLTKETTILEQIVSTAQLKKWLDKHGNLLNDPTANVIFITNMSRKQVNGFNQMAGIDSAKLIRQKQKNCPIYFYIGDIAKAEQKIKSSKLQLKNIFVGNRQMDLLKYITSNVK